MTVYSWVEIQTRAGHLRGECVPLDHSANPASVDVQENVKPIYWKPSSIPYAFKERVEKD